MTLTVLLKVTRFSGSIIACLLQQIRHDIIIYATVFYLQRICTNEAKFFATVFIYNNYLQISCCRFYVYASAILWCPYAQVSVESANRYRLSSNGDSADLTILLVLSWWLTLPIWWYEAVVVRFSNRHRLYNSCLMCFF